MKKYKILLSKTAVTQLNALDPKTKQRIKSGIISLEEDPFQRRPGADIKRLVINADPPLFRLRIGNYRVIYFVVQDEIKITEIIHRSKGYKWLE